MAKEIRIKSNRVFSGKILGLRIDTVLLDNGRETEREVVDHRPAVVIVPIDESDNVIMIRQFRYPTENTILEVPAGIVETSESPMECAQRELQEEIGYMARNMRSIGGFWASPGFCNEYLHAYTARDLIPSKLPADEDENIEIQRIPLSSIPKLIRCGEIEDAKSIAALLMATTVF